MIFTRHDDVGRVEHSFKVYGDTCLDLSTVAAVSVAEYGNVVFQDGTQMEVRREDARLIAEALLNTFPELEGEYAESWLL